MQINIIKCINNHNALNAIFILLFDDTLICIERVSTYFGFWYLYLSYRIMWIWSDAIGQYMDNDHVIILIENTSISIYWWVWLIFFWS